MSASARDIRLSTPQELWLRHEAEQCGYTLGKQKDGYYLVETALQRQRVVFAGAELEHIENWLAGRREAPVS